MIGDRCNNLLIVKQNSWNFDSILEDSTCEVLLHQRLPHLDFILQVDDRFLLDPQGCNKNNGRESLIQMSPSEYQMLMTLCLDFIFLNFHQLSHMFRNIKVKSLGKEYRKLNHQNSQCLRLIGQLLLLQLLPGDWMICNLAWKSYSESNYTTKMSISTWNLKFWNPTYRNHRSLQKPVESPRFPRFSASRNL